MEKLCILFPYQKAIAPTQISNRSKLNKKKTQNTKNDFPKPRVCFHFYGWFYSSVYIYYCDIACVASLFGENGQKSHTKPILPPVCGGTIYKLIVLYYTNFIHSSANKLSAQHNNNIEQQTATEQQQY